MEKKTQGSTQVVLSYRGWWPQQKNQKFWIRRLHLIWQTRQPRTGHKQANQTSGTKGSKAKGKRKEKQQTNNLEDDQFNATVDRRSAALEKLAASQSEKARNTRNNTYLNLLYKHTINYDEDMLRRHKQVLDEIFNCIHQLMWRCDD